MFLNSFIKSFHLGEKKLKNFIAILLALINTQIIAMEPEIKKFKESVMQRAKKIEKEKKSIPSLKELEEKYEKLLILETTPNVQFFIRKKRVKEALWKAKRYHREKNYVPFFRILQDKNIAEAYHLENLIERGRKYTTISTWPTEPLKNILSKNKKSKVNTNQTQIKQQKIKPTIPLPVLMFTSLEDKNETLTAYKFDVEESIVSIKNIQDLADLCKYQYLLAMFIFLGLDPDTPGGDFSFRKCEAIKKHTKKTWYKEWMQTFLSLAHMLNYTRIIRENPTENKKQLGKAIIGVHRFITELSYHPKGPEWTTEKNIEFIEKFAAGKTSIEQAKQELKINFSKLSELLSFFPKEKYLSEEKKILISTLAKKQSTYYKHKVEKTDKYIPSLYYPDDLDEKIIKINEDDLSNYSRSTIESAKYSLYPLFATLTPEKKKIAFHKNVSPELIERRYGLFQSVENLTTGAPVPTSAQKKCDCALCKLP